MTSAASPTFSSPALEKLKLAGSSVIVAAAVINELNTNTPSPLNQVFRFIVLSSLVWNFRNFSVSRQSPTGQICFAEILEIHNQMAGCTQYPSPGSDVLRPTSH